MDTQDTERGQIKQKSQHKNLKKMRNNNKQTRDRRLKDEEHRPNHKQTKRQKIERVFIFGRLLFLD
jgi:hypothetical protein